VKAVLDHLLVHLVVLAVAVTVTLITQCLIKQEAVLVDKAILAAQDLMAAEAAEAVLAALAEMVMCELLNTAVLVVQDYNTASVVQHSFMLLEVMAVMKTLFISNIVVQVVLVGKHARLKVKDQQMV
jgi:hypothetical protein